VRCVVSSAPYPVLPWAWLVLRSALSPPLPRSPKRPNRAAAQCRNVPAVRQRSEDLSVRLPGDWALPLCLPPLARWRAVARSWIPFRGLRSARCTRRCHQPGGVATHTVLPRGPRGRIGDVGGAFRLHIGRMRRTGRGSRGLQGLPRLSAWPPPSLHGAHWRAAEAARHRIDVSRWLLSESRRCWVRALQPHRRDASRGGKTRSKSWFGWRSPPPSSALDALAPWPSRDLRSVRFPQLSS
jgi:hypothetical protein